MNLKTKLNLPQAIQTEKHLALPISGHSGLCASFYDPDQLDMEALKYAKQLMKHNISNEKLYAADVGCSPYFPQAIRFAQLGLSVDAFDVEHAIEEYESINQELGNKINYIQTNLKLRLKHFDCSYSIVYSNRFISHITFYEARNLLQYFIEHANIGCRFYISFSSLESYESSLYSDCFKPVEERYSKVSGEVAKKHQLTEPMCLYSRSDIYDKLLKNYPIKVLDELTGSLSIKVIFSKI
jgi:hypothetical protein